MPSYNHDEQLIDAVSVRRGRLTHALLFGTSRNVRSWSDRLKTFLGSAFIAALVCAVCVGISFVSNLLAEARESADTAPLPSVSREVAR